MISWHHSPARGRRANPPPPPRPLVCPPPQKNYRRMIVGLAPGGGRCGGQPQHGSTPPTPGDHNSPGASKSSFIKKRGRSAVPVWPACSQGQRSTDLCFVALPKAQAAQDQVSGHTPPPSPVSPRGRAAQPASAPPGPRQEGAAQPCLSTPLDPSLLPHPGGTSVGFLGTFQLTLLLGGHQRSGSEADGRRQPPVSGGIKAGEPREQDTVIFSSQGRGRGPSVL